MTLVVVALIVAGCGGSCNAAGQSSSRSNDREAIASPSLVESSSSITSGEPSLEGLEPSPAKLTPGLEPTPTSAGSPAPAPSSTALLVFPAPLRIDGLGQVVADRLRMRAAPEVSPSSAKLEPLLDRGTVLFVIAGPITGSGYGWYMVTPVDDRVSEFRYRVDVAPIGWVARAARDGTPWLTGASVDCPDPGAFYEDLTALERLGPLMALSCYGHRDLAFRAVHTNSGFLDEYGPETYTPAWLIVADRFRFWAPPNDWTNEPIGEPFETAVDPDRFPNGPPEFEADSEWDVVGHFDDAAAAGCRIDDPEHTRLTPVNTFGVVLMCRTTFVVTDLHPFTGIDPG